MVVKRIGELLNKLKAKGKTFNFWRFCVELFAIHGGPFVLCLGPSYLSFGGLPFNAVFGDSMTFEQWLDEYVNADKETRQKMLSSIDELYEIRLKGYFTTDFAKQCGEIIEKIAKD